MRLISKLLLLILLTIALHAQQPDTLFILQTTDVHGHIYPYNYFKGQTANYGLAKVFTRVSAYRLAHKNVILLDGGDLLQGTPLAYYFNNIKKNIPNPLILTLNYMGYAAMTVGNHDIEQGLFTYLRCRNEADFPWLSANSLLPDGRTFFKPYVLIQKGGLKIAVLGLTTPGIPMWLDSSFYPGITWRDMVKTAREYIKVLRPQADLVVGLFHAGLDSAYSAAQTKVLHLPNENASGMVAHQVPGFDVILAGHSHKPYPDKKITLAQTSHKPLLLNAGSWGKYLGVAEIIFRRNIKNGTIKILSKSAWLESMKNVKASTAILELTKYYHNETLKYIHRPIARLTDTLNTSRARFEDNAVVEMINKAQMQYLNADLSFAACFNDRLKIAPGAIRIKDIYGMYPYENFLYLVQMSGQQIKDFLEYSARYFVWDGKHVKSNPKMAGYNYDMAEGISYRIDVRKPAGQRIEDLIFIKTGQPLQPDKIYSVALNSYRAGGGGGNMAAAKATHAKIVKKSTQEIRAILAAYIEKLGRITAQVNHNWKIVE